MDGIFFQIFTQFLEVTAHSVSPYTHTYTHTHLILDKVIIFRNTTMTGCTRDYGWLHNNPILNHHIFPYTLTQQVNNICATCFNICWSQKCKSVLDQYSLSVHFNITGNSISEIHNPNDGQGRLTTARNLWVGGWVGCGGGTPMFGWWIRTVKYILPTFSLSLGALEWVLTVIKSSDKSHFRVCVWASAQKYSYGIYCTRAGLLERILCQKD